MPPRRAGSSFPSFNTLLSLVLASVASPPFLHPTLRAVVLLASLCPCPTEPPFSYGVFLLLIDTGLTFPS